MSLLAASVVHLLSFVAILATGLYRYITIGNPTFWLWFFSAYCIIATGVVALALNQLRYFLNHVDEIENKRHENEGYETIDHSVNAYDSESGETYNAEYFSETLAERRT